MWNAPTVPKIGNWEIIGPKIKMKSRFIDWIYVVVHEKHIVSYIISYVFVANMIHQKEENYVFTYYFSK